MNNVQLITKRPELALKQTPGFLAFIDQYKALEAQYKAASEAWGAIKTFMLEKDIERIDLAGERGIIALENDRRVWTYTDDIDDEFLVKTLDPKKLKKLNKLADAEVETPGTAWTRGKRLAKRLK